MVLQALVVVGIDVAILLHRTVREAVTPSIVEGVVLLP